MLLGSTALDVAIGLVFVYLVLSLVCSALNEGLESKLKYRSKDLEQGIRELLNATSPETQKLVATLYDHPLISGLFKADYAAAKKNWDLPSYIPSRSFALALMDIVAPGSLSATTQPAPQASNGAVAPTPPNNSLVALRSAAVSFATENQKVSTALVALIDSAGTDPNQARQNVENWFNSSMDRVSGWYKRRSQWFLLGFGLLFAVAANVDTVAIVRLLSTDSGVRDALVGQATAYASNHAANPKEESAPAGEPLKALRGLGLPLGWDKSNAGTVPQSDDPIGWLMKIIGFALTATAVSLGAPFWFDLLNKFILVRSTVKPPTTDLSGVATS
jgi:hypothetical protein